MPWMPRSTEYGRNSLGVTFRVLPHLSHSSARLIFMHVADRSNESSVQMCPVPLQELLEGWLQSVEGDPVALLRMVDAVAHEGMPSRWD